MQKIKPKGVDKFAKRIPSRKLLKVERNKEIISVYQRGFHSMQDLADHYGLSKSAVWFIIQSQ